MSADLKDFATRYTAAWCGRNPQTVAEFFSPEGSLTVNSGAPAVGRAAILEVAQGFMTSFPDIQIRMDDLVIEGERVSYHWTLTGTHTGPGGKGNRVRISGVESWKIGEDGLIAESLGNFDDQSYQRQIAHTAGSSRLALDISRQGDIAIVKCSGKLVAGENDFFYKEVSSLIPGTKKIVLDLTDLTHMDSMGLGGLVRVSVSTKLGHCELELVNLGKRIRELLGITHLLSAFTICGEHSFHIS